MHSGKGFRPDHEYFQVCFCTSKKCHASWGLSHVKFLEDTYSTSISRVLKFSYWKGERDPNVARRSFHSIQKWA